MQALRLLNLMGNPITSETDYRMYAIAYCPQLAYVDFEAVEADERQAIKDSAMAVDEIRELDEKISAKREAAAADAAREERLATLSVSATGQELHEARHPCTTHRHPQKANCAAAELLLVKFIQGNDYMPTIRALPGFEAPHIEFEEAVQEACNEYADAALGAHDAIETEIKMYNSGVSVLQADAEASVHAHVLALKRTLKQLVGEQQQLPSLDTIRAPTTEAISAFTTLKQKVLDFKREVITTRTELGKLEVQVGEQAEQMLDLLDTELRERCAQKASIDNAFFEKVEMLDNLVTQKMVDSAEALMVDIQSGKQPAGATEEQLQTMSDREAFVGGIKESNGHRLTQLNALWDSCRKHHAAAFKQHLAAATAAETKRSRSFLTHCDSIRDSLLLQIDELLSDLESEVAGANERRGSLAVNRHRDSSA